MALSAIEIYNKPVFAAREQIFSILMVNAWEALFKAKLVMDAGDDLTVLYIKDGEQNKRNRRGHVLTIDLGKAMDLCPVPEILKENLRHLVDVRNAATHLSTQSDSLPLIVFTLGSASLRNYARLLRDWFDSGLNEYNFYILPLGFSYPFRTLAAVDLQKEPEDVARIVSAVTRSQDRASEEHGFYLVCELRTSLVSAKKISDDIDLTAKVDPAASDTVVLVPTRAIDHYPYTYIEAFRRVKEHLPNLKQREFTAFITANKIKGYAKYSAFNFPNKSQERRGPTKNTAVIYNDDFVRFCIESLKT